MNIHTRKQEILQDFDRDYMQSYKGDSGLGGNDPQEPVYDFACEPKDVRDFLSTALDTLLQEVVASLRMEKEKYDEYSKYCGCDGECFAACSASYNRAVDEQNKNLDHLLKEGE